MTDALIAPLPRETRYQLRDETEVVVQRRFDCEPREVRGRLLDLTVSGAKLSLDAVLPVEESVTLYFRFGELNLNFMVDAQIRWVRAAAGEQWWLGCAFAPKMPEEHLASLAGKGYLEWRPEARRKLDLSAGACWEMTQGEDIPIRIADLSSGGVGLRSPRAAAPGQRIIIHAADTNGQRIDIPTRCQWQVESAGDHWLGCSFLDATGFARLSEVARHAETASQLVPPRAKRQWLWPFAGASK